MTSSLIKTFETNDLRFTKWVNIEIINQDTFYVPHKYQNSAGIITNDGEYDMVLRLAEQYLIRGEARAQIGDLTGANEDINKIRARAGLTPINIAIKDSVLALITRERKVELFSEWSHRWFDLKRTNTIDKQMSTEKADWTSNAALFPIPVKEIGNNPKLTQNPGY